MRILLASLVILLLLASGCQRYARSPLNLRAHWATVQERDPAADAVVAYADQINRKPSTAPYDPADGLSLEEAEVVALFFSPQLRLARLRANAARVGAAEAGRWQDPELSVDAERIIESVTDPWVLAGTLSFTLPLSGRLGVEKKQAQSEITLAELRAVAEERAVLAELRIGWVEWSVARERATVTRQVIEDLRRMAEQADRLRQVGELGPLDARLLRSELARRSADLRQYEADARSAEIQLKTKMGLLPTAEFTLVPAVSPTRMVIATEEIRPETLSEHPRLRAARAEYEVAERMLELEMRRQYPDVRVGGGFGTDEGDERVLFGVAVPLPVFNANRRAIAEARANREVARATAEAVHEQLLGDASAALVQLQAADDRLRFVEEELAPLADRQVEDAQRLAQAGELDALVVLESLRAAHEAKLQVLDAHRDLGLASFRMEALLESEADATVTTPTTLPTTTREVQR